MSAPGPADIAGRMKGVLLGVAFVLLSACRTTETRGLSSAPTAKVRVGTHARTWEVHSSGEVVGLVVLFQERGDAHDQVYVVRNPWQQDLGLIDGLGRAFRYVPHLEDPAWVGSGTIAVGAQRILGANDGCELVEIDAETASAGGLEPRPQEAGANEPEPLPTALPDVGLPQSTAGDLSKD